MGSGFSRESKQTEKGEQHPTTRKPVCESCGGRSVAGKTEDEGKTLAPNAQGAQILNLETGQPGNCVGGHDNRTKKFFFYPTKNPLEEETLYVTTSNFPYSKPKAVVVRQHVIKDGAKVEDQQYPQHLNDIHANEPVYPKLNAALQEHLGVDDGKKPYHMVNDRRWSKPVIPSSGFARENVLPHKTVSELRRNGFPAFEKYEGCYSYSCNIGEPSRRPPTPSPAAWYPIRRTNDYLVASSLLAMERERDRIQVGRNDRSRDIHDF